jgi:thiosulfate dehydrogenase [quinone] large subunit
MINRMRSEPTTYLLARLPIAMSMFGQGLIRLIKLQAFSEGMVKEFNKSPLPEVLVIPFSYALPFVEFLIGVFLLIGLYTRKMAITGVVLMTLLILGSSLAEQWNNVFSQLFYGVYFAFLFRYAGYDYYSVDRLIHK